MEVYFIMIKPKRIFALILLLAMVTLTIAGCTKDSNKNNEESANISSGSSEETKISGKLVVWVGDTVENMFKELASEFTLETGVEVEIIPFTGLAATDKLALDGPAGKGGDVYMQGSGGILGKAVEQGLFIELPEDKLELEKFTDGAIDGYVYKGKLYGLPMGLEVPAFIYNKKLVSSIPEKWDDFITEMKKITDIQNDKYGFLMDITNPYFFVPLFDAEGGYVFRENNGVYDVEDIGLNNDGSKKVFKMLKNYVDEGILPKNMGFDVMQKKFTDGKAAVIFDGPWSVNTYLNAGLEIGVAPIPQFSNGNYPRVFSGSYGLAISAYTKNFDAALEFLEFATSKNSIMKYFAQTKRIPPLKECLELDEIKNDPIIKGFSEQFKHSIPQPNVAEMDMIWGPMMDGVAVILSENRPVDETFDQAVAKIKELIATMKK